MSLGDWVKSVASLLVGYWDEVRSHDPWRDSSLGDLRAESNKGIRLFDLSIIHLKDHGYYARTYRNGNLLVVFDSWLKYKFHNRVGAIGFEIGWDSVWTKEETNTVWCFGFKTHEALHATGPVHPIDYPKIVGNVYDPFCIDRILEKTKEHFHGPQ